MLRYSTRFKVKDIFTKEQFVKSVIKWCSEKKYPMKNLESHISELSFFELNEKQSLEVINSEKLEIIAARHIAETSKGTWIVDAVLNYNKRIITVYMDHTVSENSDNSNIKYNIPWITRHIIDDGFAEKNLGFDMKTEAISLDETNKSLFLSAIDSNSNYALPIVYLSSNSELTIKSLTSKLAGLAIVVSDTSDILCNNTTECYNAPIYVFLPHKMKEPVPFGKCPFHRDIIRVVADFLNSRSYDKLETWEGVEGEIHKLKFQETIENLKKKNADNEFNNKYLEELEYENREYSRKYEEMIKELNKLKLENERLNYRLNSYSGEGTPLIICGNENDIYPNEQKEIIIEILKSYLKNNVEKASRRADILRSIIEANNVQGIPAEYRKIIKEAFEGYNKFNVPKIINALKKTGIDIINHKGHYKLQYNSDPRYTYEAASTPSDFKSGANAAAIINKLMF